MATLFLIFGIAAGLTTANYDIIRRLKWGEFELEAYQRQIDTIKNSALDDIRKEFDSQKESLALVTQKTASMVTLFQQLQKKTEQSKTDLEKVIGDLKKASAIAQQKLDSLEQKTSSIITLPDGRVKLGNLVTGMPTVLQANLQNLQKYLQVNQPKEALVAAESAIKILESTSASTNGPNGAIMIAGGNLSTEGESELYGIASELLLKSDGDAKKALLWAKKSVAIKRTSLNRALVILASVKAGPPEEVEKLYTELMTKSDPESIAVQDILKQAGLVRISQPEPFPVHFDLSSPVQPSAEPGP